mgnify:FL=1
MEKFENILNTIKLAWEQLQPELLSNVLGKNLNYYETPNQTPLKDAEQVIGQWHTDLATQSAVKIKYNIIKAKDDVCIATWEATWHDESKGHIDAEGVFYIEVDNEGKLEEFRQWWV